MTKKQTDLNKKKPTTHKTNKKKTAQSKAKKSTKKGKVGSFFTMLFILLFGLMGGVAFIFWQGVMQPVALTEKAQIINIKKGQTFYKLIDDWQAKGLISNAPIAKAYTKFFIKKELQTGAYQLNKGDTLAQVLQSLANNDNARMVRIQIIEGKRSKDLLNIIAESKFVTHELTGLSNEDILDTLAITEPHLEGVFSPNTYFFNQNITDIDILQHLYDKQKNILDKEWQNRQANLPYKSAYEALIMASIIEKETALASERGKVAAVFVNRLRKGMKLQTDPTVIYGMGKRYDGDIRKKDLLEKTPYNTYQIDGLPPTPIALPSQASIHAALNPDDSDALFFVATGHGGHTFTRTYAEHKKAVRKYLKVLKSQKNN